MRTADDVPVSDFDGTWYDSADGNCYNGLATNVTFSFGHTRVPNSLIYGIAYNTSDYGAHPYGDATACHANSTGCGYDSLNVALTNQPNNPSVGSDPQEGTVYEATGYAPYYCDDGAAGVGVFRQDAARTPRARAGVRPVPSTPATATRRAARSTLRSTSPRCSSTRSTVRHRRSPVPAGKP